MKSVNIIILALSGAVFFTACGGSQPAADSPTNATLKEPGAGGGVSDAKGKGKFTDVVLTHPLNDSMVHDGSNTFSVKCAPCHKLTEEKLGGPGWEGVTDRRTPEWIMNFLTNTDEMIDKDPAAQELLDKCMVRMPNQHLNDEAARSVLEFMRSNDGKK